MKLLVHVRVWNVSINEVEQDKVGDIDDEEQFEDGVPLLKDGCFFLLEAQERLDDFHL